MSKFTKATGFLNHHRFSVLLDNQLVGTLPVIPLEPNQLNLFSDLTLTPARRARGAGDEP